MDLEEQKKRERRSGGFTTEKRALGTGTLREKELEARGGRGKQKPTHSYSQDTYSRAKNPT